MLFRNVQSSHESHLHIPEMPPFVSLLTWVCHFLGDPQNRAFPCGFPLKPTKQGFPNKKTKPQAHITSRPALAHLGPFREFKRGAFGGGHGEGSPTQGVHGETRGPQLPSEMDGACHWEVPITTLWDGKRWTVLGCSWVGSLEMKAAELSCAQLAI